jgi:hypothetical protein
MSDQASGLLILTPDQLRGVDECEVKPRDQRSGITALLIPDT